MTSSTNKTGGGFGWPVFGSLAALVVCPALELITGAEWSYTLPIFIFFFLFWALTRMSRAEIGLRVGGPRAYVVSLVYAFLALSTVGAGALLAGDGGLAGEPLGKSMILALQIFAATWIGAIITEDGYGGAFPEPNWESAAF